MAEDTHRENVRLMLTRMINDAQSEKAKAVRNRQWQIVRYYCIRIRGLERKQAALAQKELPL
jgi:hypothetical protein